MLIAHTHTHICLAYRSACHTPLSSLISFFALAGDSNSKPITHTHTDTAIALADDLVWIGFIPSVRFHKTGSFPPFSCFCCCCCCFFLLLLRCVLIVFRSLTIVYEEYTHTHIQYYKHEATASTSQNLKHKKVRVKRANIWSGLDSRSR